MHGQKLAVRRPDLETLEKRLNSFTALGFRQIIAPDQTDLSLSFFEETEPHSFLRFLNNSRDDFVQQGWEIELAPNYHYHTKVIDDWNVEVGNLGNWWFSLDIGVNVDGKRIPLLPIIVAALREQKGDLSFETIENLSVDGLFIVNLPDGTIAGLPLERLRPILTTIVELYENGFKLKDSKIHLSAIAVAPLLESDELNFLRWSGAEQLKRTVDLFDKEIKIETAMAPVGLKATLRTYQIDGLSWLQFLAHHQVGGILADDMGLGKTVQSLAHILSEQESGRATAPNLVVCPTSVLPNWIAEAKKFAPDLTVLAWRGSDRSKKFDQIKHTDLVVTTYSLIVRDITALSSSRWHSIILDESQIIKNPDTKIATALTQLTGHHKICLTGTPVENHLGELWAQFSFLIPGLLGTESSFTKLFRHPIERNGDWERQQILSERLRPFMVRRTKEQVAPELPPKEVIVCRIPMHSSQRDLYEAVRLSVHESVQTEVVEKGWNKSQLLVLNALLKLRQVCCHPRLLKIATTEAAGTSSKLNALMEMLNLMLEEGRSILLFSQFTAMLDIIKEELLKCKISFVELTGNTVDRETPVSRFQNGEVRLFLLSLKAGGTGLNLTAADTVIHYDPWWNPAAEDQATDRAHRIGQTKPVFVYKLITEGTIEERMLLLQERKKALAHGLYDQLDRPAAALTQEDMQLLFEPLKLV